MQLTNINNTPSFCGLTKYLQREIYDVTKAQKQLLNIQKSEFVGQLPADMIKDIIKISKSPQEKKAKISHIMNGFSDLSNFYATPKGLECKPKTFFEKCLSFFQPKNKLYDKLKYVCSPDEIRKILNIIDTGAEKLTKTFQDAGLLKKRDKIKIEYLGQGCSGKTFKIIFPKRTGYTSKVFKVFKKTEFERKQSKNNVFNLASAFHEINSMIYLKKAHKGKGYKNSEYVEGYLASLKNKFMLLEDVYNYPPRETNPHIKIDDKFNLILWDKPTEGNVLNGRMVDYGYIQQLEKMPYFLKHNPRIKK